MKADKLSIILIILLIFSIFFTLVPFRQKKFIVEQMTEKYANVFTEISTSTVVTSTFAPVLTILHSGGELPSAVSEISFHVYNDVFSTILKVERSEGLKYPFTFGVFLSDNPNTAIYCILMKPWFPRVSEGILLNVENQPFGEVLPSDISIYPQEKINITFEEKEMRTDIHLSKLSLLIQDSTPKEFYTWLHVWALGNERYLFDFMNPTRMFTQPTTHMETIRVYDTKLKTITEVSTISGFFTTYHRVPLIESSIITPFLILIICILLVFKFLRK